MPVFRSRFQWLASSPTVKPPCFDQWLTLDLSNLCGQVFSPIADVARSATYLSRGNGCQGSPNSGAGGDDRRAIRTIPLT